MKIKVVIEIDESGFEFEKAVENIDPDNEMTKKEVKDMIHDDILDKVGDMELSEIFPDWSDLFLS